jgi:hypothetical protein
MNNPIQAVKTESGITLTLSLRRQAKPLAVMTASIAGGPIFS